MEILNEQNVAFFNELKDLCIKWHIQINEPKTNLTIAEIESIRNLSEVDVDYYEGYLNFVTKDGENEDYAYYYRKKIDVVNKRRIYYANKGF